MVSMVLESERQRQLAELARSLHVDFVDFHLLNQALLHSSYINERDLSAIEGNERLEFLGDAVLGLIVTEELYRRYDERSEGEMSKVKSVVVSRRVLAEKAKQMGLGKHIQLGRGEELTGGRSRKSILANTFESLVGAVFLSGGIHFTRQFVLRYLEEDIEKVSKGQGIQDHKSELQERLQQANGQLPRYRVTGISGPDHDKLYRVEVLSEEGVLGVGEGKSKKSAEQAAARQALQEIQG